MKFSGAGVSFLTQPMLPGFEDVDLCLLPTLKKQQVEPPLSDIWWGQPLSHHSAHN